MPNYNFSFQEAQKQGYTPDQINQFLAQQQKAGNNYQLTDQPQATPQQSQQPAQQKGNGFTDLLPTIGGVVGGIAGGLVPGLGETGVSEVGGAAIGQAGGEALKDVFTGQPIGADVAEQGAAGAVGGVTGLGVGKLAGGVLGKLGEAEATNGLNLTRLQQNALKIKNSESVADTLTKHGIAGTNTEGLTNGINKVQDTFDSIAKNNNVPLNQDALLSRGTAAIEALKNSSVPSDQALASQVDDALGNVMDKIASGKVTTLADLNTERQAFDNATKDSQFGSAPWGVNRVVGDVLRNTAYDTADASNTVGPNGESLQAVGQNLRKLYNISNIAEKRVGQGSSAGPLSVSNMLLGGLGAAAGSVGGPLGSVAGYAAFTGARKALANPVVAKALTSTLTNAGTGLATPIGKGVATGLGAGTSGLLPVNPGSPQGNSEQGNNSNNNPNQSNTLPSSPQAAFTGDNSTINSSGSQALPATTGTPSAPPDSFLKGYTVNGAPIDDNTRNLLYQIVNYKLDPTKLTSLKNNERQQIISLASQADPSYDSTQFPVKQKLRDDYTSGTTGKNIQAINTAIGHLYALSNASGSMGNTNFPAINSIKNSISYNMGNPQTTSFETIANAVSGEVAKIYKSSGATDTEIAEVQKSLNPNMSPAQFKANLNATIQLMGSRLDTLNNQYTQAMGKPADFQIVTPESQQILQALQASNDPNTLPATPQ